MTQSYITAAQAANILRSTAGGEKWETLDAVAQNRALVSATMHIDALQNICGGFKGDKSDALCSLEFPRTATNGTLPQDIETATALEALQTAFPNPLSGLRAKKVGNASESYINIGKNDGLKQYLESDDAAALVKKYINFSGEGSFKIV